MPRYSAVTLLILLALGSTGAAAFQSDSAQPMPRLSGMRVILRVTDLDRSIAFYRDKVGLPLISTHGDFAEVGRNGLSVVLHQLPKPPAAPSAGLLALTEVVFDTPDVLATYRALKERGIAFRFEPFVARNEGDRDLYVTDFRDPDGHILSIAGWVRR